MGCCDDAARVIFIILNVLVLLLSAACVGLGIWALTSDYGAEELSSLFTTDLYTAGCVTVIVAGSCIFLLSFLGCLGAVIENKIVLFVYLILMFTFLLAIVVGAIVAFFFLDEIEDKLADNMKETLLNEYHVDLTNSSENKDITEVWNSIQKDLKCCGVRGSLNSSESWFLWQSSEWYKIEGQVGSPANWWYVPSSCCNTDYRFEDCQRVDNGNTQPPKPSLNLVTMENPALYHEGCLDKLQDKIQEHMVAILVTAGILFLVLVFCVILAIYMVCAVIDQQNKVV